MPDRAGLELERHLEAIPGDKIYRDLGGAAVYKLEPSWCTAMRCGACGFVNLVLSIPRKPSIVHPCPACGRGIRLLPPLEVLAAKAPSVLDRPRPS